MIRNVPIMAAVGGVHAPVVAGLVGLNSALPAVTPLMVTKLLVLRS